MWALIFLSKVSNIPLEHTPDPQPIVYEESLLSCEKKISTQIPFQILFYVSLTQTSPSCFSFKNPRLIWMTMWMNLFANLSWKALEPPRGQRSWRGWRWTSFKWFFGIPPIPKKGSMGRFRSIYLHEWWILMVNFRYTWILWDFSSGPQQHARNIQV